MANVTKIRVSVGYTRNAGNYESARVEETIEADVQPGESTTEAITQCREFLKEKVYADSQNHVDFMKAKRK